jgi:hypothetical protein
VVELLDTAPVEDDAFARLESIAEANGSSGFVALDLLTDLE